ncbi:MAG TPA: radical SAM protein [Coleofasciculaceae cyanobacterium]|jgi:radical SAM superfamily enzyme YgiQ (UPF0313 family)
MSTNIKKPIQYRKDQHQETYLYQPVAPSANAVRIGMVYPAPYQIAMSSLGYLVLFQQMDQSPEADVRRIYADTLDQHNPRELELMGFSFSFELDIVKILDTFATYDIPMFARDREREHPLVFAGGPVPMSNPEPFAEFFDFFLVGEGEEMMTHLLEVYRKYRNLTDREELIHRLAMEVPGLYAPGMYEVRYTGPDGPVSAIVPKYDDIPPVVQKQLIANMDDFVASTPIISDKAIFSNTLLVEVMRGCAHRCRFCLASYSMLPPMGSGLPAARGGMLQTIIDKIEEGTQYTNKVGLLGALISDHPQFPELCDYMDAKIDRQPDLTVSSSSLRVDTITPQIANTFKKGGQKQLTLAIESGSDRMRRRINKNLKHDQILEASATLAQAGLEGVKFYGMVGLPDETDEDVEQLASLLKEIRKANPKLKIHLGCSSFVPKAGTPFQWQPKIDNKLVDHRFEILRKSLLKTADVRASSAKWDYFQAFLSRGDRRLSKLIVRFYQLGGSLGSVNRAYKELKEEGLVDFPDLDWYALRERPESEILPWDMISLGTPKDILWKEGLPPPGFERAFAGS